MIEHIQAPPPAPFDTIASSYDEVYDNTIVTRHLRQIFWDCLMRHFKPGEHILEVNCGTGTDAIYLAKQGIRVTALDASSKMIEVAERKSRELRLDNMISFYHLKTEDINKLSTVNKFDGAYSNFGGLNCVAGMPKFIEDLQSILKPGSYFIGSILNTLCPYEIIAFLLRGKFGGAFRRFHIGGVEANIGGDRIHVWYYSPQQYAKMMDRYFEYKKTTALSIFSPPPNSIELAARKPKLTKSLLKLDDAINTIVPFYMLGDHFIIEAEKRE